MCRAGDNPAFCAAKTPRPCGANEKGCADAPPLSVLRVSFLKLNTPWSVRYLVCLVFWMLFFSVLFLLLYVLKGKKGRTMAPFGSPSVPAGSSSPTTPDSCLRTRQAPPNPQAVSG